MRQLRQAEGVSFTRMLGLGAARGDLSVPNEDLVTAIDSSDEWIRQRTGIVTRSRASGARTLLDMAEEASREALERAGVDASDVDAVLVATISNPHQTPAAAPELAYRIGADSAPAYDLSAACAGYAYGIVQADALIRAGAARFVLVVGAEKLSDIISPTDRTISFLLGDGAGAAVIGPSDAPGISASVWGSDGSKAAAVSMSADLLDFRDGIVADWPYLRQDGPAVFRWAVWAMADIGRRALDAAAVAVEDIAAFIPHQANARIIDELAKQIGLPDSVLIARDIVTTGNTSSASIPLAAHRLLGENPELSGGLALQMGFGAGVAYAAQVVVLP